MKRISKASLAGALGLLVCGLTPLRSAEYFVALNGDDAASGTKAHPFATLERARDAAREAAAGQGATIWLRGGLYRRSQSFLVDAQDSGATNSPMIYAAWPEEDVVLSGAVALKREWFMPVTDPALLGRIISEEARDKVLAIDLKSCGITNYGAVGWHGYGVWVVTKGRRASAAPSFLYVNGKRLSLARWPNPEAELEHGDNAYRPARKGVVRPSAIIEKAQPKGAEQGMVNADTLEVGTNGGVFAYDFDRPERWKEAEDIWIDGVLGWTWEWTYNRIASIDHEKRWMTLANPEPSGLENQNGDAYFFFDNLLEEIDQPGEYYFDCKRGIIYLYPPTEFNDRNALIELSVADFPLVKLQGVSDVSLRDLTFDMGRGVAIQCDDSRRVRIERCEVRNFLNTGIQAVGGMQFAVTDCHFHDMGGGSVMIAKCGDIRTLALGEATVEHCYFHDWGWYSKVYCAAVATWQSVGTRIAHSLFHDSPHVVLNPAGNDTVVEYNEFRNVVRDFIDMGVMGGPSGEDPLQRGLLIRRNYFHDIGTRMTGQHGVYPDLMSMGSTIEENVFARIGNDRFANSAVNINSGAHITTRHNVFVNCPSPIRLGKWAATVNYPQYLPLWKKHIPREVIAGLPHAKRYPELLRFWDEPRQFPDTCVFEENALANPDVSLIGDGTRDELGTLQVRNNYLTEDDPGFVNMSAGNYALKTGSVVYKRIPGFPRIPFNDIGLKRRVGPFAGTRPLAFVMPAREPGSAKSRALSRKKPATASGFFKDPMEFGPASAVDGNMETRWIADAKTGWLEVDLGEPTTFSRVRILAHKERVRAFELQKKQGEKWETFYKGTTIRQWTEAKFAPVTAQAVRLTILEASGYPEIAEFQLLAK